MGNTFLTQYSYGASTGKTLTTLKMKNVESKIEYKRIFYN